MGFFNKLGKALIEEVPITKEIQLEDIDTDLYVEDDIDANISEVNLNSLVDDIYANNDLLDTTRSIFKVNELIDSLPKEMVTETKRTSVLAILSSFGLTSMEVIEDGEMRIATLQSALEKIVNERTQSINEKLDQIEDLKKQIAILEGEIADSQEQIKTSKEVITREIERIKHLVEFIGGEN